MNLNIEAALYVASFAIVLVVTFSVAVYLWASRRHNSKDITQPDLTSSYKYSPKKERNMILLIAIVCLLTGFILGFACNAHGVNQSSSELAMQPVFSDELSTFPMLNPSNGDTSETIGLISELEDIPVNPATGYPMVGCLDIAGNPYGTIRDSDTLAFAEAEVTCGELEIENCSAIFDASLDSNDLDIDFFSGIDDITINDQFH